MDINLNINHDDFVSTSGGECWIDRDYYLDEYGIQIGGLSISGIPPNLMCKLACAMVNHLQANGHEFEFVQDQSCQDLPKKLTFRI